MAYTIYKSTDSGAPQITNTAGAFKAIIKACLITGYGTGEDIKNPAGWDLVYDGSGADIDKIAVKPVDTNGENLILRVDNSATNPQLNLYSDMTDINTGTATLNGGKVTNNNGAWVLVATEKWLWYFITTSDTTACTPIFCGNVPNPIPEQSNKTLIVNPGFGSSTALASSKYAQMFRRADSSSASLNLANLELYTGFDALNYNIVTSGDLLWFDVIAITDGVNIHGIIPALKATNLNADKDTLELIADDIYYIKVGFNATDTKQMILDLTNVS